MGHVIAPGIGTASLDTFGGLITQINPSDLPEGASPRTWDTDFIVGSVFTRAGLASVYVFTEQIQIPGFILRYHIGTFNYIGKDPTINEGFVLSGFTGAASFLNGLTVFVLSVDTVGNTFTAEVDLADAGPFSGLTGIGSSTTGNFTGPNLGGHVTVTPPNVWTNPNNILGSIGFASASSNQSVQQNLFPAAADNVFVESGFRAWVNPNNLINQNPASAAALVVLFISAGGTNTSEKDLANGFTFALPPAATVVGISTSLSAGATGGSVGSLSQLIVQLASNGTPIGTSVLVPLNATKSTYVQGGPSYQWGTTLTPSTVNGGSFGVLVQATTNSVANSNFSVNALSVTVYYTTTASETLQVTVFNFVIPVTSGISGFESTFQARTSTNTSLVLQLMKNGVPVGDPRTQNLTTINAVYTLGAPSDLWGSIWSAADVNNTNFGVQVTAVGDGTTFINDLDIITYLIPGLSNFNYIKSFVQNDGQTDTLALDSSGIMWQEDVTNDPGKLSIVMTGILPGSFAKSATALDREYICFSDLNVGTDRPRVYDGTTFSALSPVGPGAPPSFASQQAGNSGTGLTITAFKITGNVVTYTYSTGVAPTAGQVYSISGASPKYLNITGVVLSVPAPDATHFSLSLVNPDVPLTTLTITALATLATSFPIASITQPAAHTGFSVVLQSAGPGQTAPGSVLTIYYSVTTIDGALQNAVQSGQPVYVYISGLSFGFTGTYLVTGTSIGKPPGLDHQRFFFTVNVGTSGYANTGDTAPSGSYQQTLATVTTTSFIPNLVAGGAVLIASASPGGWNGSWPVVNPLKGGILNITSTQLHDNGTATYGFNVASGIAPQTGQLVTVANTTGDNGALNVTGVISGQSGSTFTISGFPGGTSSGPTVEDNGTAETFGLVFTIDPGAKDVGTNINPIFGNDSGAGKVTVIGAAGSNPIIGEGTRLAVVFFITATGYETAVSPPTPPFTTTAQSNSIAVTKIPIGPPGTIARGIAFTEAGQNGVPGANFYVIPNDVVQTVGNVTTTFTSTIIRDNTSTTANFSFTDAVLLNSQEIDIQGNDLFNLIEIGSPAWCIPYASRMFYGLCLNKIDNLLNPTFDGGYLPNTNGPIFPLGWTAQDGGNNTNLLPSPVTGQALYISNSTAGVLAQAGYMNQPAYVDAYKVPIINPNTTYSIRVACSCPSGIPEGVLTFRLEDFNPSIGPGTVYGTFTIPLTSMTTNMAIFEGTLLTAPFTIIKPPSTSAVPTDLSLSLFVANLGVGADCLIDRFDIFPTLEPFLLVEVLGSYVNNLEAVDASGSGGILDTSSENAQPCMGGFVMHDTLYLLKKDSMVSTEDNPSSEPGGWGVKEVSNRVGAIGISSYDTGEEWAVTAGRSGIYGFNGGAPTKLMQEIWNVWNLINWEAGNTIVLRNDIVNKRILCAIPLPTPNKWLPFAPLDAAPTSPNVILMCNYQGLNTFEELINSPEMHTTMFGTLAAVDMKRKWSIWQVKTPYMDFIVRPDKESKPLFVCNGIDSSKIYQFLDDQLSDDGVAINSLYTTYGFVNAAKAATLPIFGFHAKRYTVLQVTSYGSGTEKIRVLPNLLDAKYPYTVPGGLALTPKVQEDWFRTLNIRGNRAFLEFSTNAVGEWFNLSKVLLSGKADPYPLNATGGGNLGYGT